MGLRRHQGRSTATEHGCIQMKPSILSSPAHTSLLEIKPLAVDGWEVILSGFNQGLTAYVDRYAMSDGEAANLKAKLIHKGWTEQ